MATPSSELGEKLRKCFLRAEAPGAVTQSVPARPVSQTENRARSPEICPAKDWIRLQSHGPFADEPQRRPSRRWSEAMARDVAQHRTSAPSSGSTASVGEPEPEEGLASVSGRATDPEEVDAESESDASALVQVPAVARRLRGVSLPGPGAKDHAGNLPIGGVREAADDGAQSSPAVFDASHVLEKDKNSPTKPIVGLNPSCQVSGEAAADGDVRSPRRLRRLRPRSAIAAALLLLLLAAALVVVPTSRWRGGSVGDKVSSAAANASLATSSFASRAAGETKLEHIFSADVVGGKYNTTSASKDISPDVAADAANSDVHKSAALGKVAAHTDTKASARGRTDPAALLSSALEKPSIVAADDADVMQSSNVDTALRRAAIASDVRNGSVESASKVVAPGATAGSLVDVAAALGQARFSVSSSAAAAVALRRSEDLSEELQSEADASEEVPLVAVLLSDATVRLHALADRHQPEHERGDVTSEWIESMGGGLLPGLSQVYRIAALDLAPSSAAEAASAQRLVATVDLALGNSGPSIWPADTTLSLCAGEALGLESLPLETEVAPGQQVQLTMRLQSPDAYGESPRGSVFAAWVLEAAGQHFGPLLVAEMRWPTIVAEEGRAQHLQAPSRRAQVLGPAEMRVEGEAMAARGAVALVPDATGDVSAQWESFLEEFPFIEQAYRLGRVAVRQRALSRAGANLSVEVVLGNHGLEAWPASAALSLTFGEDLGLHSLPIGSEVPPGAHVAFTMQLYLPRREDGSNLAGLLQQSMWALSDGVQLFGPLLIVELEWL